ncbi:four-helix bundle copper-binding protein [Hyphomicrobium sp.]|uniref:four-helix bundle copper-binding protein n=1 Tax=Hyphomicrobium sp. TaxID=82 RepID=UPI000FAE9494|nr:four-helix bundle copper-binding protein [Hyphomicrobium sp.]RUO97756.1 MAG: four-helix bundle copper-binding protein [Hyphomicrobium sp.]
MNSQKQLTLDESQVSRRTALGLAASAGLAQLALASKSATADDEGAHMDHMDHMAMDHGSGLSPNQTVIDVALNCVKRGDVCFNHCITLLSKGDTSIKDCIRTVSAMLPTCSTLAQLASLEAARLKEFAKVCIAICEDCEKECKRHADHHAACKNCMESCVDCIKECKKLVEA